MASESAASKARHKDLVREEFTRQANEYAAAPAIRDLDHIEKLVRAVGPSPDARVLEVATGPGHVAMAFAKIARDETGHAVLAREVAAWAATQLDARANARVKRARGRAVAELARSSRRLENKGFERVVGWPTRARRSELIQRMVTSLALA